MINDMLNTSDLGTLHNSSQQDNVWLIEHEFSRFIQESPLRQEIFNAIERLETCKISLNRQQI